MHHSVITAAIATFLLVSPASLMVAEEWSAPAPAEAVTNPTKSTPASISAGARTYRQSCAICHGPDGKGDGTGGIYLVPKPNDLTDTKLQKQSDGSLFWKLTIGRNAMPGWKANLTDEQRWQSVDHIRSLAK